MTIIEPITWDALVRLEPKLGQLLLDCRFADRRDPSGFDPERMWDGSVGLAGLKQRLEMLVGPLAEVRDDRLISIEAFELASKACKAALPPLRSAA